MQTIRDVYASRNRGPWSMPAWLEKIAGVREKTITGSRQCEAFPHNLNRDTDFYLNDDCITYYCPQSGMFTVNIRIRQIVS